MFFRSLLKRDGFRIVDEERLFLGGILLPLAASRDTKPGPGFLKSTNRILPCENGPGYWPRWPAPPRIICIGSNFFGVPVMWSFASEMTLVRTIDESFPCDFTRPQGATLSEIHESAEPSFIR